MSENYTFLGFLDFSDTQRHLQDFRSCFAPSSNCVSSFKSLIVVISLHASAIITSEKLVVYPRCTQAPKSAPNAFVTQSGNASACLSHSSGPWILNSGAFDHLFGNKDNFFLSYFFPLWFISFLSCTLFSFLFVLYCFLFTSS